MRCLSCNKNLSDQEATRKSATLGDYLDLCNKCFSTISDEVPFIEGACDAFEMDDEDYLEGEDDASGDL